MRILVYPPSLNSVFKSAASLTFVLLDDGKSPLTFGGDIGGVIVDTLVAWFDIGVLSAVSRVVGFSSSGTGNEAVTSEVSTLVSRRESRTVGNNS